MYRKTITSIEQSTHEQLFERDCRCVRNSENLSTHTARHSYATSICLANGVSMENVAKMLGHADTSVTKHYARVLDQNILKDMQKVNSCLSELAI